VRAAHIAGAALARNATAVTATQLNANVAISRGLTPYSRPLMAPFRATASPSPIALPNKIIRACCARISRSTLARVAPIAMRIPISCVRRTTEYEITPYTPTAASSSANTANALSRNIVSRRWASDSDKRCSNVETSNTGTSRFTDRIIARSVAARPAGIASRGDHDADVDLLCLREWQIDLRFDGLFQTVLAHIFDDPDDLQLGRFISSAIRAVLFMH
jgi:hypothetical protein